MGGSEHIYVFEGFRLDQNIPCLYRLDKGDKTPVALGDRAFELLCLLIECAADRKGEVVSKKTINDKIFRGKDTFGANTHVQIGKLRKALGRGCIKTVTGSGYRFVRPVTRFPGDRPAGRLTPEEVQQLIEAAVSPLTDKVNDLVRDKIKDLVPSGVWLELKVA